MEIVHESVLDRLAQGLGFCRRSDEREWIDRDPDIASFRHDHIDDEIFHRDIQHFLDVRLQSVDLVDKEDISGLERIQNAYDLRRFRDGVAGHGFDVHLSLLGDDVRHRRLPESAGTGKEDVAHVSLPFLPALYRRLHDAFDMFLSYESFECVGSSWVADVHQLIGVDLLHFHTSPTNN